MLAISLSGCDELEELGKEEYIIVTVNCDAQVFAKYANDPNSPQPIPGAFVDVSIVKAGGERIEKTVKTDSAGKGETVSRIFHLYKEQSIVCYANVMLATVQGNYPGFVFNSAIETIAWEDIYPLTDFGKSTTRTIPLSIIGTEST